MADSFNKKEREKKRQKKKQDKAYRKEQKKLSNDKPLEFMYLDKDGNLTEEPPSPTPDREVSIEDIEISTRKKDKSDESKFARSGTVKFFNTEKGYGFIVEADTNISYFVHADNLKDMVKDNDRVKFEIGKGPKGPIAMEVELV